MNTQKKPQMYQKKILKRYLFYKDQQFIITETGWPTTSTKQIKVELAHVENQKRSLKEINAWSEKKFTIFFL